jgi:hypothetical protein
MFYPVPFAWKSKVLLILVPEELKNSIVNAVVLLFVIVKKSPVAMF